MTKEQRTESTPPQNWGGARKKSGRPKLAPSSSVRVDTELLRQLRKFTRWAGNPRALIECAVRKELLERQTIENARLGLLAVSMIETHEKKGRCVSPELRKIAKLAPPA